MRTFARLDMKTSSLATGWRTKAYASSTILPAIGYHYRHLSYAAACRRQETVYATRLRFETTEADQYVKNRTSKAKPMTLKRRLILALAKAVTLFLVPLTPLLDTRFRLPGEGILPALLFSCRPEGASEFRTQQNTAQDAKAN